MKRTLSFLLTLLMLVTSLPMNALVALAEGIVAEEAAEVEIPLGNFAIGGVGQSALTASEVLLSQKTLITVPYTGATLLLKVNDGYQVRVHSGNNYGRIDQVSDWFGSDGLDAPYEYQLPASSIYMRVSLQRADGGKITAEELTAAGLSVSYRTSADILKDNAETARILQNTDLPVLIHLSDIHGDVIRAERAATFAEHVKADAMLVSGDLTAYRPADWGTALLEAFHKHPGVNVLYGTGNHDSSGINAASYEESVFNAYYKDSSLNTDGKTYYFRDLSTEKLRIISVNQQEGATTTTSGGTRYSQAQVDWLIETLQSTPAGYGVVLMYHSPETTIASAAEASYPEFFQVGNRYDNPTNSYSAYTGTFLMDLVDAFMMREKFTWNYSEKNAASPVTVSADFTKVANGVEFIAHVTGHVHADTITYLPGTACKQLLLGVTCTTSMYGEAGGYYGLADYSDLNRAGDTASQDAFNAYVIDRESKTVRILRVGAKETVSGEIRDDMTIPYSIPFEEGDYPFDTEGLIKLDLSDVEWVNYGIQPHGIEPTYLPNVRWSPKMIFDVPYEGVTFYIKINAPYEMGIRSGATDTSMNTNYYWLNNKVLSSGSNNRGYIYTIPSGHTKFIFSLANVHRDGSGNTTALANKNLINALELNAAGLEIWYKPCSHAYENDICTICGAKASLSLSYDDRYDVAGKEVEIIDAGKPTSYQVGYGVAEGTLDTAVVTLDGDKLIATGIGTAKVKIDGVTYTVTVKAAPISLLLLAGQSNMQGIDGNGSQSIVCPDGMVYATYADRYQKTVEDVTVFAPSALAGQYRTLNAKGGTEGLANYPVYMLTEAGNGREGMDSGIAYEWAKQTGEKVWVINLGYGGSSITQWQTGGVHYEACADLLEACYDTLRKEIAAGHFTLSHTGYFWCQGCADETQTAAWYVDQYKTMHETFKSDFAFDENTTFEFGGIIPIRAGHSWMGSYRGGVYETETTVPYYQSFKDLRFNGPRVAQYWMGNNPALTDIWNVCTIQEGWATLPDGTDGVKASFLARYENGKVDYTTQVQQSESWYTPKTPADVHDNIHYNQIGYNEIGREAARNALILLKEIDAPEVEAKVTFMTWDGFTPADTITSATVGSSSTLVVPMVSPVWKSKEVTYTVSDGMKYDYYDLLANTADTNGTLEAVGAKGTVKAVARKLTAFHWVFDGEKLVSVTTDNATENPLNLKEGSITDGQFSKVRYQAEQAVALLHDKAWVLETELDNFTGTSGVMLLGSGQTSTDGQPFLYFRPVDSFVGIGYYDGTQYHNHGISLKTHGISLSDGPHTYRLENRIAKDGTNMVYLSVDGKEIGSLTNLFLNSTFNKEGEMWLCGKDLSMPYLGTTNAPISGCTVRSLRVWEDASLPLSYDDRYDVAGKEVEIIDAGVPTSYQVGYGVAEGTLDTAVVTLDGDKLIATGIGTAKVKIDGVTYTVTVKAAPISLLLLIGQSNMRGSEGNAAQSIVCPDGMVYSTYGDDRGESNPAMTVNNATSFAPSALTGPGSLLNVNGNTDCLGGYPLNSLTADGAGRMGPDSGFAYEWVKQTGEKVWVVNAAHGGTSITTWQKGKANYEEALLLFGACQETLRKEIAAGHYTLSHMGYFWCQGCSDRTQTAEWYVEKYLAMHENLKKDLAFDEDTTFEFGGIIPVRVGSTAACYRDGVQTATNSYAYHESFVDLRMNGPRVAQYWMINNPALSDIWGVCNIGDDWVWMPDGTNGVEAYFNAHYENGRVDYTTQVAQKDSWYTPTTPKAVHDSIHYNQIGYNEIGRESVRNALILLGVLDAPEVEPTVEFVSWDGFTPVESINANTAPGSETLVVPLVSPVWKSKEVTYALSDSLTWEYYDLLAVSDTQSGTLSSPYTNQTVTVSGHAWSAWETVFKPTPEGAGQEKRVCADCGLIQTRVLKGVWQLYDLASHMQTMPEAYCKDTNLWAVLEHDPYYFASGTKWSIYSSGEVPSVTIPVEPGDKIFATSFGKAVENGHATSNGIRVTFFGEYGVVKTMDPAGTYKEFSANGGYLIAPEGAIAINVAMWNGSDDNELYVLNRDHVYENGTCAGCGDAAWDTDDDGILEILAIGNSFSVDAMEYLWQIADDLGVEKIVLGNLYIGGCSLETHAANAKDDLGKYTYYHNDNGTWTTTASAKISTALAERDWDFITLQQWSATSGVESSYNEDLTYLIDYVKERSEAKLGWHMTWAYQQDSTHKEFPRYNNDQMTMYNAIVAAAQNKILPNGDLAFVIPAGTAVQNSRTSLLGDTTTRDGYHMSKDYGRYLLGLMWFKELTGLPIDGITYAPSGVDSLEMSIAIESVNNAYKTPLSVTNSSFTGEVPTEGYVELKTELYQGAFWHSTFAEGYNVLQADKSNSHQFFATPRLTKEDLPIGSIIILENGWKYRPEGWVTDTLQTTRENATTQAFIMVTEEWWKEYTLRGFNVSLVSGDSVMDLTEEELRAAFRIFVPQDKHVHKYVNLKCTLCGESHPAAETFDGKVISILSASTSTFEGYTPVADGFNLDHRDRYPQDNLLTHVNDTWWMQTIHQLNAKLGINDSWAGSQVLNTLDANSGDLGPDAAMASITRIKNLGANGTPDVILFFGGGNDMGRGVALGSFDPATAPTEVDLTATKWESFADAYVAAIMRLQYFYPEAKILAMTTYPMPSYVTQAKLDQYGPVVQAICEHYGVEYLSLQDCGVTFEMLPDNIHPNAEGMDYITAAVVEKLTDTFVLPAGETVVHTVTHNLSQAKASLGYYKGISAGKSFEETLTGEDLAVTVTMGGVDITETAYKNGVISIPAVTGDLVITAKGKFTADGHLQQLPEVYCPATNLWQTLTPENIYYTVDGWGNTSAGTTWSITFPVKEGDRIWATSLGAYPDNGSSANGVRITWFDENGVLQTLSRDVVYAEFAKNGYVTAPAGAVALNVPMTGNQAHYAVYILSAEHKYQNSICTVCGEKEPLIPVGWSPVPLSTEKNSDHLAYKLENGVLIFHDFGESSMEDYGRLPDYTNSDDQLSRYSITEWYQSRADIHAVRFDETISYVGQYTLTNMDKVSEFRIDNPTATVAVHAVLFSTTDRKEPLEIYAASTLNTTESWIRGNGNRKISAAVSKVTMFYTDLAHLAPALSELESALQNAEAASPSLLYEALALVKDIPQNNYNLSDYTPAIPGAESTLAFLWDLTSGSCGESVTYRITAGKEKGTFKLSLKGDGSMTAYAKQSDVPWNVVMDAITNVTIEDGVNGFCDLALPKTATYRMHLNSPAYAYAAEKGLTIRLETLRILCIGNSHTVDYSEFLPSILKDLQNAGLETDFVISKATIGSIGLYSGRNSNINATHRSHLEALQNSAGAYKSLKNNRYDLIIIQDYMESVVDDPQTFAAGLATFIQAVRTVSEGQGTPEIAWFTDWVDIRSTGGDSALYDGNGNKIYLEVLSREQVYEKSLANIAYVEKAIAAGTPNMPDFVIHASTIKQNAMSSYLGASKLYDKNAYCLLERDTTHLTYELGRYLMGAGVLSELINHYSHVLDIDGGSLNVGNALTVENGPAATGTGSQYTGAVNEEILSIIREAISSPLQFKPSVYTQDPVDKFLQSVEEMEWNPTDEPEKEAALQLLKDRIQASFGSMVESYTVEMVSYASPYDFTFSIHVTHGYTIRKENFTIHICRYTATVTKPTCTEKGYTTYTCSCGDSYVADETAATGHSYGEWHTVKEPTCTTNGEQRRNCTNCDQFETKSIPATGHSYTATVTKPTCTAEGYTTYTCHCGDSYVSDKTPATGHSFGEWETVKDATCTADGEQRRDCANCDHYETKAIAATGHSYKAVVTKPTCTTEGYTTYTCHCGDSYVADKIPATGHTYGDWETVKEATCISNGEQRRDCANCDHFETKVIAATGHSYKAVVTKPTCTTEGYTTYTCHCGDSYVADRTPAVGHSFGQWYTVKEATCTSNGEQRRDCANCDAYETKVIAATGHSYKAVVTKPTCTTEGYTTYTCHCGDSYIADKVPALGHSFGNWETTKEATCTANGEQRRDCRNCDHFETKVIAATGHNYQATITKPTCTEGGYTTYTCHCGDSYVADKVPATGHSFGEWTTTKEATCTANGEQRRECKNCDHFETKTIAATGHSYQATVTKPTCTAEGFTTYTCHCGDSYVADRTPATGHTFGQWYTVKEATCTATGEQRRDCANCDRFETKAIAATGHSYTSVVTKPTCTAEGFTTYTCHCGDSYVADRTPATGHSFGQWYTTKEATCTADGTSRRDCANCDAYETKTIAATGHDYGAWYTVKEAACTENGLEQRDCKNCNHFETNLLPATGHSYTSVVTKPTCTEGGYTTYTCHCGDSYVADRTPATGHSFGQWYTVEEATCTADGTSRRNCANCDAYETKTIAATGHDYGAWYTVKEAACTENGLEQRDCKNCNHFETNLLPATGHSYTSVVTKPTCTEGGFTTYTCKCGASYVANRTPATGHSYTAVVTKPTCTTEGFTTYTCHCGDSYVANKTPATGHSFGQWYTTKEATCTENGTERRDCKACDVYETKVVEAIGHSYQATVTKPTCTEDGYTTYTCKCGDSYVADRTPATGHSYGEWETVKEATCLTEGSQRRDCLHCNSFEVQILPATGHIYGDWYAVKESACTENGLERRDCKNCNHFETQIVPATGHVYEGVTTKPTCTTEGFTTYTCKCGASYVAGRTPATGHSYTAVVTKPTCTTGGYTTYTCHCGDSYVAGHTDPTGHTWDDGVVTVEPTEETTGTKIFTCTLCGEINTVTLPTLEHIHSYEGVVTQPTCTEEGYTTYTCRCGDSYVADRTPALGHSYESVLTQPTCTEKGYYTYTCTVCGDYYVGNYIPATGHAWDDGVVTVEPTEETTGTKIFTCTICGEINTVTLPALEHIHSYEGVVTQPTCTEEGFTTYTCRCGDSYVADRTPATGHSYNAVVTEPTCTEQGYTTYTCHCGDSYVDNYADPAGHTWGEWQDVAPGKEERSCTACGETESRDKLPDYDVDGNGTIDQADVKLLMSVLVGNTQTEMLYDFDFDGTLTIYDCVLLTQQIA